jgi:hypothetical protein
MTLGYRTCGNRFIFLVGPIHYATKELLPAFSFFAVCMWCMPTPPVVRHSVSHTASIFLDLHLRRLGLSSLIGSVKYIWLKRSSKARPVTEKCLSCFWIVRHLGKFRHILIQKISKKLVTSMWMCDLSTKTNVLNLLIKWINKAIKVASVYTEVGPVPMALLPLVNIVGYLRYPITLNVVQGRTSVVST